VADAAAGRAGLTPSERAVCALIATELATNLSRHARDGRMVVTATDPGPCSWVQLVTLDSGPGIPDVEAAMADGYSTANSLGGGLGACRRAAGAFDVYAGRGTGTVVIARVGAGSRLDRPPAAQPAQQSERRRPGQPGHAPAARVGGILSARPGEQESGDGWCAWWGEAGLTVTIVDGLGHGPEAALAGAAGDPGPARAESAVTLLDIIADQDTALDHHRRELESTDRGLLALHTEQAEQLTLAGERQRELLETEQAARAAAEAARARLVFLSHVGAVLGASLDHRQVVSRLSTLLVPRYAGMAEVWLRNEQGRLERYGVPAPAGPAGPPEIVRRVLQTRRPQQQPNVPGAPDQATVFAVPLTSLGTVLGVLSVTPPNRPFAHDDVIIVSEVAGRAAAALANALRFEQEREVAERLQHAMLTELPTGPGVECAARYLPAVTGLNVGGDWYDAFRRPDGTLVLAVGDVAGHGLAAATLMGQLRTAMRAYAMDLPEPGEVLTRLHALIRHIDPDHCATAILAMVSPTDGLIERRDAIIDAGIDQLAAAFQVAPGTVDQIADTVCEVMLRDSSREDDTCLLVCQLTSERAAGGAEPPAAAHPGRLS
jgi:anti-sigma regulatory factor (Ser/Thr protein kinase)